MFTISPNNVFNFHNPTIVKYVTLVNTDLSVCGSHTETMIQIFSPLLKLHQC